MKLPTVLNLEGPVVVFGGGNVGLRKVEYLMRFTDDIVVVAEEAQPLPDHVKFVQVKLNAEDIKSHLPENTSMVVAALSDEDLNHSIAKICTEKGILVNVVDDPKPSTIFFPALSSSGDLNIAISTSGKCPFLAKNIRMEIDDWIQLKGGWLEVLTPIRESLLQKSNKDIILLKIYKDPEIGQLISQGKIQQAIQKAKEMLHVYSEH
jgi:precorrin-2 dehydrogenase/sirohydrochlorin ferrochelatase